MKQSKLDSFTNFVFSVTVCIIAVFFFIVAVGTVTLCTLVFCLIVYWLF